MTFDTKPFFRTIITFWILDLLWTFLCIKTDELTMTDRGLVSGCGYLLLFAVSFYVGQKPRPASKLWLLIVGVIIIFLLVSFVLLLVAQNFLADSLIAYSICSSVLSATLLTGLLHVLYGIEFRPLTIVVTSLFALAFYCFKTEGRVQMFNLYQGLVIIPLAAGLSLKRKKKSRH